MLESKGARVARSQQIPAWLTGRETVRTHVFMGGRGSGKTATASGYVLPELLTRPETRVGVLGPDFKVAVGVAIEGQSGIRTLIERIDKTLIHKWDAHKNILTLVNGSQVFCYSSEYPKSIEGPEFHLVWVDEIAELAHAEECYRKRLEPAVRLVGANGEPPRKIITGTPAATDLILDLHNKHQEFPETYAWTQLATIDNIDNIDKESVEQWYKEFTGDRKAAYLEGHLILESPHALLVEADLAAVRIDPAEQRHKTPEQMDDMILAVDANHSDDAKSDECGIIIMGRKGSNVHIFGDASLQAGPKEWGERIIEALKIYPEIDEIIVEDDKSLVKEVVETVLRDALAEIGRPIKIRMVKHGNKSKKARAEPVAVEYQLKNVLHDPSPRAWSDLAKLEWQWKSWNPKAKGKGVKSPDRVDACVYGVTFLKLRMPKASTWFSPFA